MVENAYRCVAEHKEESPVGGAARAAIIIGAAKQVGRPIRRKGKLTRPS